MVKKSNEWIVFRQKHAGKGISVQKLAEMYKSKSPKRVQNQCNLTRKKSDCSKLDNCIWTRNKVTRCRTRKGEAQRVSSVKTPKKSGRIVLAPLEPGKPRRVIPDVKKSPKKSPKKSGRIVLAPLEHGKPRRVIPDDKKSPKKSPKRKLNSDEFYCLACRQYTKSLSQITLDESINRGRKVYSIRGICKNGHKLSKIIKAEDAGKFSKDVSSKSFLGGDIEITF